MTVVLVTGATGYVGRKLVPLLLDRELRVRVLVRNPERLAVLDWFNRVEVVCGDAAEQETLRRALSGVDAAYYLIHSMTGNRAYAEADRRLANNFVKAAGHGPHVIYLGGLLPHDANVSRHLSSRAEVGGILRSGCRVTEFRAGPIIGKGSASYDMVRYLMRRLPVMITPKWVSNRVQPIAVHDVLAYLIDVLGKDPLGIVDIGGDVLTFKEMMLQYAEMARLKRFIFPVPILAPTLAALWVGLVTPIPNSLAIPLIRGMVHPVVADTRLAEQEFPHVKPVTYREAVRRALLELENGGRR